MPKTIRWDSGELYFLDQTLLPLKVVEEKQETVEQVWDSIKTAQSKRRTCNWCSRSLRFTFGIRDKTGLNKKVSMSSLKQKAEYLDSARPTAVNLKWALDRMIECAKSFSGDDSKELFKYMEEEAIRIHNEDEKLCLDIGNSAFH